ncbi:Uncharacterised protein [Vibrio cholerae]|nr:Uncharacterised protein [Vibrio cholerae]
MLCQHQSFRQTIQHTGNTDLIDHLSALPLPCRTHQNRRAPVSGKDRLHLGKECFVATTHNGQDAIFSASLTTRNRSIHKMQTRLLRRCRQLFSQQC